MLNKVGKHLRVSLTGKTDITALKMLLDPCIVLDNTVVDNYEMAPA